MKGSRKTTDLLSERRWKKIAGADEDGPEHAYSNHSGIGCAGPAHEYRYTFTDDQLQIYGASQVQVLEGLLQQIDGDKTDPPDLMVEKIQQKINWESDGQPVDSACFLREVYVALRGHIEG